MGVCVEGRSHVQRQWQSQSESEEKPVVWLPLDLASWKLHCLNTEIQASNALTIGKTKHIQDMALYRIKLWELSDFVEGA